MGQRLCIAWHPRRASRRRCRVVCATIHFKQRRLSELRHQLGGRFALGVQMERDEYKQRNQDIKRRYLNGEKIADLAREYEISRQRASQIAKASEKVEPDDDEWRALKSAAEKLGYESILVRTYHIVKRGMFMGLGSQNLPFEQIPRKKWREIRNCGRKTLELLYEAFPEKAV